MRKTIIDMLEFQEFKNPCFKPLEVSFRKESMGQTNNIACKQAFLATFSYH